MGFLESAGKFLWLSTALLLLALFLTACGLVPGFSNNPDQVVQVDENGTPIPTPTRDPSGYQAVPATACQIADMAAMQTDKPQGDLIAWRPVPANPGGGSRNQAVGTVDLAYMAPAERTSWYTGDLLLVKGPDYKQKIQLAPAILAAGDLTWSPEGDWLAFLALRSNESVYTVMVVRSDGSNLTDLFPTDQARSDSRSSQKAILGWKGSSILQVMTSCGEECRQAFDIHLDDSSPAMAPTQVANYHDLTDNLQIHRNVQEYQAEELPKNMNDPKSRPNWSPDLNRIVYLDKRGLLWLLSIPAKTNSLLDIGLRDVAETQWSADNRYLAIRAEDRIFIFQVACGK